MTKVNCPQCKGDTRAPCSVCNGNGWGWFKADNLALPTTVHACACIGKAHPEDFGCRCEMRRLGLTSLALDTPKNLP